MDPDQFVNPPGYPSTTLENLKVIDSFLGGFDLYGLYPVTRGCMEALEKNVTTIVSTYEAWTNINVLNDDWILYADNGTAYYNIYNEEPGPVVYNASELISGEIAPMWYYCATGGYRFGFGTWQYYNEFGSVNIFLLSGLQAFLGKVFTVNKYFLRYEYAVQVNDVNVQWYNLGKILRIMVVFEVISFAEPEDPTLDWDQDNYQPFNASNVTSSNLRVLV